MSLVVRVVHFHGEGGDMTCRECDRLDKEFIRPRTERTRHAMRGTLTPEIEARLDSEEGLRLTAIVNHRVRDHKPVDVYE